MSLLKMKEPVNTWTHFLTFIAGIAGLVTLVALSKGDTAKVITMSIYGISILALYGASSLYHWVKTTPQKEAWLRKLDHAAIYFFIAGSYTPVFYYGLSKTWKWPMLTVIWVLAILGIGFTFWRIFRSRKLSAIFYLLLGWIAVIPFPQLIRHLPHAAIIFMIAGGIAYSVGAFIYATRCLNFFPGRFGFHEIFHLFISAGSILHFVMIQKYILPL
ncbi:MAG: hemolysin III family protein [Firmicutes bacterium]|jgi:hemolysin III|nr:hemolysin III family protein [Bacillota bacterium]